MPVTPGGHVKNKAHPEERPDHLRVSRNHQHRSWHQPQFQGHTKPHRSFVRHLSVGFAVTRRQLAARVEGQRHVGGAKFWAGVNMAVTPSSGPASIPEVLGGDANADPDVSRSRAAGVGPGFASARRRPGMIILSCCYAEIGQVALRPAQAAYALRYPAAHTPPGRPDSRPGRRTGRQADPGSGS